MFVRRCLHDTGFVCRHLCGWDYDDDGSGNHRRPGGVRAEGAHQEIVEALDDTDSKYKLLEAPRGSYKSTIIQGFITRQILRNPNVRILYGMKTDAKATEKALAIRKTLELPKVTELFGPQKGDLWQQDKYTVGARTQHNLQEPTLSTFSLESLPTGGHYDFIIVDDLIDHENCRTQLGLETARNVQTLIHPLLVVGGTLIYVGTRYDANDLYADLERNPLFHPPYGITKIYGAGVSVNYTSERGLDLLEDQKYGLTFPHLTIEILRHKLMGMSSGSDFFQFSCQYLNVVPTSINSPFRREKFHAIRWETSMQGFTGYLLTDTATSTKDEGCHSVIAYALLDQLDNCYIVDLRVGHWRPPEFVAHFFDVLEKWHERVNHAGEVWEDISLVTVYETALTIDSRARKIRLRPLKIGRGTSESKHQRILRLEPVFQRDGFHVVSTIPRKYTELDGERTLFDPDGHRDVRNRLPLPGGELVRQFVEYKPGARCDIADALAMLYEIDRKSGKRTCTYKKYLINAGHRSHDEAVLRYLPKPATVPEDSGPPKDWWSTITNGTLRDPASP